jgi:hypothetical protein
MVEGSQDIKYPQIEEDSSSLDLVQNIKRRKRDADLA